MDADGHSLDLVLRFALEPGTLEGAHPDGTAERTFSSGRMAMSERSWPELSACQAFGPGTDRWAGVRPAEWRIMSQLFLPLLLMLVVAIPLVMGTRKQKRAAQEQQQLQNSLNEGDRVMTTSGLYGTVADISSETTIDIEIAPGIVTTWLRQAVREKVAPEVDGELIEAEDSSIVEPEKTISDKPGPQIAPPLEHETK